MQENILFFKLYLLSHKAMYIDYMFLARKLASGFNFERGIPILADAIIMCGSCYSVLGKVRGGAITFSCSYCDHVTNLAYEIQQLCTITGLDWKSCVYCICKAVEDIYKANDVSIMNRIMWR